MSDFDIDSDVGVSTSPDDESGIARARAWVPKFSLPVRVDIVMTTAQQLIEQGKAEGKAEGRRSTLRELLLKQLKFHFEALPPDALAKIEAADTPTLERWFERLLTATSLESVFGD